MAAIRIIDEYDALSTDPKRAGQMDTVLTYTVDARGPYYHYSPKATYNYEQAVRAIQEKERARAQHVGRTFTV